MDAVRQQLDSNDSPSNEQIGIIGVKGTSINVQNDDNTYRERTGDDRFRDLQN